MTLALITIAEERTPSKNQLRPKSPRKCLLRKQQPQRLNHLPVGRLADLERPTFQLKKLKQSRLKKLLSLKRLRLSNRRASSSSYPLPSEKGPAQEVEASNRKCRRGRWKNKSDNIIKEIGGAGDGENLIQCTLCDAKVVQLVRHIRAQHGDDPDYDNKIKEARLIGCILCCDMQAASTILDDLTITVSKMSREPVVDRRTIPSERGNSLARLHDCIRCGLSFKTRSAMIGHVRKVHDKMYQPKERLFECEECNKKFYKKFHLQRHIRVHTGELMFVYSSHFSPVVHTKPFVCAFCEKMFASKTNMDSHIQSVHLKIKPFKCGYCEKGFARKKMMLLHIRKNHMAKDDNSIGLSNLIDIDDVTLDDNLDNESNASIESGEILGGGDSGMVLIKMRDDDVAENDDAVKQYMFVANDDLPSDLDNTLDTTAVGDRTTDSLDQSALDTSSQATPAITTTTLADVSAVTAAVTEPAASVPPPSGELPSGQVVQALQTTQGIMLVTQSATITDNVNNAAATILTDVEPAPIAAISTQAAVDSTDAITKDHVTAEPSVSAAEEATQAEVMTATVTPDLVQQALSQTVPEVTQVTAESEAELAATTEETNGEVVETYYIKDLPANGE
ncbi:hypothetical protein EB796_018302 [Bugula neritina]|uniref:C2H2-type domain-containing protein n=1 Tax=Bugula neritina TaxID=10212 RepID=A0A7J7JBE0_BUGNE|nr:hypothetical protein EB796_018302 [Bugula neritina]